MKKHICQSIRKLAANLPAMEDGNGIKVNHYRRMKRAYTRSGNNVGAILNYVNRAAKALSLSLDEQMLAQQAKALT